MSKNTIIFYDFETGSKNPNRTQPTQLAAVAIDGQSLQIKPDSEFDVTFKPILDDDEALFYGLDPIQDEALEVTGQTREELAKGIEVKEGFNMFVEYVNQFNYTGKVWDAPIKAGYNNTNFDDKILDRLCGGHFRGNTVLDTTSDIIDVIKEGSLDMRKHKKMLKALIRGRKEPYGFGPWDDTYEKEKLFHPLNTIDVYKYVYYWTENMNIRSRSMDAIRDWMGMSKENAHDALTDVIQGAHLLIRFMKLQRRMNKRGIKFKNAFKGTGI